MPAIGIGLFMFGYGMIYYGLGLLMQQHHNFLYGMFHVGAPGKGKPNPSSSQQGAQGTNDATTGRIGGYA